MRREEIAFPRPEELFADVPAERRGKGRDDVRLLVTSGTGTRHRHFTDLVDLLRHGDLLVVNESAALPASLVADGRLGPFILDLSTEYGAGIWLAEPRWSQAKPGPMPFREGELVDVGGVAVRLLNPYPGIPRLWFVHSEVPVSGLMARNGSPIRYGYVKERLPLDAYRTIFSRVAGSAEMPSAARPFTEELAQSLRRNGIGVASIVLHCGVSSLEIETEEVESQPLYPEPFRVPAETAAAVNLTRERGGRVIAVGTTVVRALESAWTPEGVRPAAGFTRLYISPASGINVVDGMITGLHDPYTSHVAMLASLVGMTKVKDAYAEAVRERYLWHEFGDSHLLLRGVEA